jgi:hypothetical protein
VWEIRVVVGFDPARGRSIQRSFTVHGDAALAGKARRELVAEYGSARSDIMQTASVVTVGELLAGYLGSAQLWKPATVTSHRHVVSTLLDDPLSRCRLQSLTPAVVRAAICRWRDDGASVAKVSARWLLIRSAVSWAVAEGLLRLNPLAGMRGPPRPQPRRHHSLDEVRRLLVAAGDAVASAEDVFSRQPDSAAGARACSPPSSCCCWSAWRRTPGRGGVSWRRCGCRTWMAGCSPSSGACLVACSARPSRAGPGG